MRLSWTSVLLLLAPAPALTCLPLPPGMVEPPPPTVEQRAQAIALGSENIVYGVLTHGIKNGEPGSLRIIHVYKGSHHAGARVRIKASWGFDPPMCAGMMGSPPPTPKGTYGVVAWSGEPELNMVSKEHLTAMFKQKLLTSASGG